MDIGKQLQKDFGRILSGKRYRITVCEELFEVPLENTAIEVELPEIKKKVFGTYYEVKRKVEGFFGKKSNLRKDSK